LFKDDEITKRIFGNYVSRYDFKRSVDDGATVPLYYENRGEMLHLHNPKITEQIRAIIDSESEDLDSDERSKVEKQCARDYPILTAKKRLNDIAKDVVTHFCNRGYKGKAMFVALDKITAVKMYNLIMHHWQKYITKLEKEIEKSGYGDQELLSKSRELQWIKETEICVVVSSEQNEIKKFTKFDLDIEPHRNKMNTEDLESRFKAEEDPFRLVIVCAMWITGFDVPSLSTMYIDKPLKAHTLMQTIARANRINTGKNNGLIVDYIETYRALLDALAIYGKGDEEGGTGEISDPPVKPNDELIKQLEEALSFTEVFLKDEVNYDLNYLISSVGLHKIAALEKAINAVYTTDETKTKFQVLAREVFKKFKALQPHKILNSYAPAKNAISAVYDAIEDKIESADVSEIMKKIQDVVDESISNMISESKPDDYNIIDLSSLNFELLKEYFLKAQNKNILIQSLKEKIEKKLKHIVDRNPLQVDFYARYQEIIDEYNRGKDVVTIEETFRKLMEFINSMSAEEAETKREGLTDEYKAIFDILRQGKKLNEKEKVKVKELSVSLLEELKSEKLCAAQWSDKSATSAAVYNFVNKTLFEELPYPTYQNNDVELMTQMIFNHLKTQYYGGGQSVYGNY